MKKRLLFFAGILSCSFNLSAQEYHPFVEDGKSWNYVYQEFGWDYSKGEEYLSRTVNYSYYFDGDTLINNDVWTKFCYFSEEAGETRLQVVGAMREEEGKVHCRFFADNLSGLLYDFELEIGNRMDCNEIIETGYYSLGALAEKRRVVLEGGYETTIYVFKSESYDDDYPLIGEIWIEGIGGSTGYLSFREPETTGFGSVNTYVSCTLNGEVLATGDEIETLFYSILDEYYMGLEFSSHAVPSDNVAYDLQGRRVNGDFTKGMYIQNGKKIVIK